MSASAMVPSLTAPDLVVRGAGSGTVAPITGRVSSFAIPIDDGSAVPISSSHGLVDSSCDVHVSSTAASASPLPSGVPAYALGPPGPGAVHGASDRRELDPGE